MRRAAEAAALLGKKIWVDEGPVKQVQLADNLADAVFVGPSARGKDGVARDEVLRLLHPQAKGFLGSEEVVKPIPKGIDPWAHPYHAPDNNTQSTDQIARYPYLTQFLGEPMFGCISEVTVAAGGRVFKAFGHIAFKEVQNEVLNTLYGINAYNGTILWKRPLKKGFMIHRNTMVATPDVLYLADDESCKLIDTRTGEVRREIKPPADQAGGTVWKWMALEKGILYAMIGGEENPTEDQPGKAKGFGGWPWGMWRGYDYKDPKTSFAFGRHLLAIEVDSGKILWRHQEEEYIDGRGVCMRGGKIFAYSPEKFLLCLDTKTGKPAWKSTDTETLQAIGPNTRAQGYITGFSTSSYMRCNDDYLIFSGPQRSRLVAVRTKDGKVAWQRPDGNFQVVLRDDVLMALGSQGKTSYKIDIPTGKDLAQYLGRRACTRATASVDSVFCRAQEGTLRFDPATDAVHHIAPMRPACHDGVIISEGFLYWGPWICFCNLSLYGHICLGPAGSFPPDFKPDEKVQLLSGTGDLTKVQKNPGLKFSTAVDGVVRAVDEKSNQEVWKAHTAGEINFPPVVWEDRVYAGSNDGRVYAFEAATGRLLWRFQAAPAIRRIPVYGKLASTWPVAGGVVVDDGVVYAAAGITHYDGTHVYALDAVTGKVKWHNGTSGVLNPAHRNGVSLQGPLSIAGSGANKVLRFDGGNAVGQANFDVATGKCLTNPPKGPVAISRTTFYLRDFIKEREGK
jgi:outer membrane protein assembly factor BamB